MDFKYDATKRWWKTKILLNIKIVRDNSNCALKSEELSVSTALLKCTGTCEYVISVTDDIRIIDRTKAYLEKQRTIIAFISNSRAHMERISEMYSYRPAYHDQNDQISKDIGKVVKNGNMIHK